MAASAWPPSDLDGSSRVMATELVYLVYYTASGLVQAAGVRDSSAFAAGGGAHTVRSSIGGQIHPDAWCGVGVWGTQVEPATEISASPLEVRLIQGVRLDHPPLLVSKHRPNHHIDCFISPITLLTRGSSYPRPSHPVRQVDGPWNTGTGFRSVNKLCRFSLCRKMVYTFKISSCRASLAGPLNGDFLRISPAVEFT